MSKSSWGIWDFCFISIKGGQLSTTQGLNSYAHFFTSDTIYEYQRNVTRSVYCDDEIKIDHWNNIINNRSKLEEEVRRGLALLFNTSEGNIPEHPVATFRHLWESGWSWLKTGSSENGQDNQALSNWAWNAGPSFGYRNCSLFLPTDSWDVTASGWGIAAWLISAEWLTQCAHAPPIDTNYYCNPQPFDGVQDWCTCMPGTKIPPHKQAFYKANCKSILADIVMPPHRFRHRH